MKSDGFKECVVCGRTVDENQGIHLLQHFICMDCERDMVTTDVEDDHYRYFVGRLRSLWQDLSVERATLW